MGRTGANLLLSPGLRVYSRCKGVRRCGAGQKPNDRGRRRRKKGRERGRKREGRCHMQGGRTEEGVYTRVQVVFGQCA